jgi:hypothetical protein
LHHLNEAVWPRLPTLNIFWRIAEQLCALQPVEKSQSPFRQQVLASRVFHLHRHAIVPAVFYLQDHASVQTLVPRVFHLNQHALKQAPASRVFHLSRNHFAPMFFHLNHHTVGHTLAPDRFFSELESG